eukprot:m.18320 g.18320  ORF g.18320 m.18320 type:complete len:239 (+) comp4947_c0_seq1:34-750(+)
MSDIKTRFKDLCASSQREQASFFLRTFGEELGDNKSQVKDFATTFDTIGGSTETNELDEMQVLKLLSDSGETLTRSEFREKFRTIDRDQNGRISFVEYLLFKFSKSVEQLFDDRGVDDSISRMNKAIKLEEEFQAMKLAREKKMTELKALVQGGGVKGMKAKHELEFMEKEDLTALNKRATEIEKIKSDAAKDMNSADPFAIQEAQLQEEAKKKVDHFDSDRKASQGRLREKANMFGL